MFLFYGVVYMVYLRPIEKQKNIKLILQVLKKEGKIRRGELYDEVGKLQKKEYGASTSYQVISRDVDRLKNNGVIKVISGGPRSEKLSLK